MQISAPCVVTLTWRLKDSKGELVDELADPVEFFYGGDDLLAGVEEALAGQEPGYETELYLEPQHAFGDYDAGLVFFEDRALFPDSIEPGMQFDGVPEGARTTGMPADRIYTVTEVYPEHVVLDGNHPLAGRAVRLDVKVADVREATPEEVEQRSVAEPEFTVLQTAPANGTKH